MPKIDIGGTGTINSVQMTEQGSTPSTPGAGKSAIFLKADGLYVIDDAGTVTGPLVESTSSSYPPYACYTHKETQNTSGGTFTSGSWQTRPMNTEQSDVDGIGSIASNQITLAAGTYTCKIVSCAAYVGNHQARLQNITATATLLTGTTSYTIHASPYTTGESHIAGKFTLAAQSVLEVQHQCQTTQSTNGFGQVGNFGDEIYAIAEFWKVA